MVNSPPGDAGDTADLGLIPGSGRFPGGGNSNPLQYSWDSLVAQTVKRLPSMPETRVQSLGRENPLEKEMALQYSCLGNPMDRRTWWATVHGVTKSWTQLSDFNFTSSILA